MRSRRIKAWSAMALLVVSAAIASEQQVSVEGLISPTDKTTALAVATTKVGDAFPLPAEDCPQFWFDCMQRTGWEFDASGNVTKIPSLVGTRALATTGLESWTGWGSGSYPPLPPTLIAEDTSLGGKPSLDFGALGSMKALVFDAAGASGANEYANIGTIIAVWGSQNGGGWILGGGPGTQTGDDSASYVWWRGGSWSKAAGTYSATFDYDSPVFGYDYAAAAAKNGVVRHDGMPTSPTTCGFNHGWEVVSVVPTAATLVATGLGIGDSRTSKRWYSGGMKVAELMIFERLLTPVEISKVEVWLQNKWLGNTVEGYDGSARVSRVFPRNSEEGSEVVADVPAGERLMVGSLEGMRGRQSAFVKTGEGEVVLKDATGFAADVRLQGGTLAFEARRPIPVLGDLKGLYLHFDASDLSSIVYATRDGAEYVSRWKDIQGGTIFTKRMLFRQETETASQPRLLRDAVGTGLHMVDFGTLAHPGWMRVGAVNGDTVTNSYIGGVTTVIAVMGVQGGGGRIAILDLPACQRFTTGYSANSYSAQLPILNGKVIDSARGLTATNGTVWVNGLKVGPTEGYGTPGYAVVAFRVPSDKATYLAAGLNSSNGVDFGGGFRIGEMFIYNRPLGDREVEDVSAYLMNRWFGREAPGYAKVASRAALADVQHVTVEQGASLAVPGGVTAKVGDVVAVGGMAKTGAGALEVESLASTGRVVMDGGIIKLVSGPAVSSSQLAAAPCLHLDAADASTLELVAENGTNFVKRWYSKDRLNAAYLTKDSTNAKRPWLNTAKAVGGVSLVDFGAYGSAGSYMVLEKALYSMRDVFLVIDGENGGGYVLSGRGSLTNGTGDECPKYSISMPGEPMDFFPDVFTQPFAIIAPSMSPMVANGEILLNGAAVTAACKFPTSAALLEFHPLAATGAYLIGAHKPEQIPGGFRLGEVVAYDRKLSARERVATRNYLMAKWFSAPAEPLPESTASSALDAVSGEGSLVKENPGALSVGDFGSFTGTVAVAAGTLTLSRAPVSAEPHLVESGRIAHFDASASSTISTVDMDGYTGFSEWRSLVGGWKAVPISKYLPDLATGTARIMRHSLNGRDTFLLGDANSPMLFEDSQGVTNEISGIRSVFWVLGTVNGMCGGYILGGGSPLRNGTQCPWMRPDAAKSDPAQPIIADGYASGYVNYDNFCTWHLDGMTIKPNVTGYQSDAWHVVDIAIKSTVATPPTAGGFAYDSRIILQSNGWNDFKKYSGNQNLAEVIFYDHVLSESERLGVEAYLQVKWGLRSGEPRDVSFAVAAGSTLDLGGATRTVGGISGSGSVVNGSLAVSSLTADAAATEVPSVSGSVALASGVVVELKNLTPEVAEIPVLRATSVSGSFGEAVFTGECPPDGVRPRLRFRDGLLFVRIPEPASTIILR